MQSLCKKILCGLVTLMTFNSSIALVSTNPSKSNLSNNIKTQYQNHKLPKEAMVCIDPHPWS